MASVWPKSKPLRVRCCIVGGGPAGMMLGFLLARSGVDVAVLEKHGDFLRDFRGDTIHPSTLEVIHELGLLDDFLALPHQEARNLRGFIGNTEVQMADFTHLPTHCKFVALMPQWDFLDFLARHARNHAGFQLRLNAAATALIVEGGRVTGVLAATPDGPIEVRADLIVAADGRHSTVRELAGFVVEDLAAPIDVLWMRLSRRESDPVFLQGRFDRGRILVMLYRGDYWQIGFVIPKQGYEAVRIRGLESLRRDIALVAPLLADRVRELADWDQVKLLTVKVDRLRSWWRPGLLCIGDAAHAMSPVGGVGINLAIQDAVAAANILADPLRRGSLTDSHLRRIERRRLFPTRVTQWMQVQIQNRVLGRALATTEAMSVPWIIRQMQRFPVLQRIPAWLVGIGVRPEHTQS